MANNKTSIPTTITIKTKRLVIRPFDTADYKIWKAGIEGRKPKQNPFDPGPLTQDRLSKKAYTKIIQYNRKNWKEDHAYRFGIFDRKTKACLGSISIVVIARHRVQLANLGYLINNQYWGRGYASEALHAVLKIAFHDLRLHRLEAGMALKNRASATVAKRIGMIYEGIRKGYVYDGKSKWEDYRYFWITPEKAGISPCKYYPGV